ncbi:MAG TPA: 2-hydroxyacyl-CoA dehydratase family protein [Thermotogota bacterium]|nr:2-hydroxyacyl-CoA dehydratase family protein [Thermotogota bacterium]HRW93079.1 2-hydroxyacyl-CoA dehydratase family protein [Thermotogota bacterium]
MNLIEKFSTFPRKHFEDPRKLQGLIRFAARFQVFRWRIFPDRSIPRSLRMLNRAIFRAVSLPLSKPKRSAWVNLFAPTEILHAFGIHPLFVESLASFLTGMGIEDLFIDRARQSGISETLCSFHQAFIGAVESDAIPTPRFALASSMICDANTRTFVHVSQRRNIPCTILDVPSENRSGAVDYVKSQLKEAVSMVQDTLGEKLDPEKLRNVLRLENETREAMRRWLERAGETTFPNHATLEMSQLALSHTGMGLKSTRDFYRVRLSEKGTPRAGDKRSLFWIHIIPFMDPAIRQTFNFHPRYSLVAMDINADDLRPLELEDPLASLARKMVENPYNGPFQQRLDRIMELVDRLHPDGVIHFCQWGCKQSTGGSALVADALKARNVPVLVLDGDAGDRRNMPAGQAKTRLEAFLEMIK